MDELTLGGKTYVSSKRAAEITGYAKDYVGQLCREGQVEAKMVGRSWYVLETAIRTHRFGESKKDLRGKAPVEESQESRSPISTWERPKYSVESHDTIPEISKPQNTRENLDISDAEKSLSDMQAAWKEWFEQKDEPLLESPEVIDAREEEHEAQQVAEEVQNARYEEDDSEEVAIPLNRLEAREEAIQEDIERVERKDEESIPIQRIPAPTIEHNREEFPVMTPMRSKATPRKQRASLVAVALLIAVGGFTVAVALVGTGYAAQYAPNNPIIQFLAGTSIVEKASF